MNIYRFSHIFFVALCLILCSVASIAQSRLKSGEECSFAIPRVSAPPVINGTIDKIEWREAVAVSGTVEQGSDILDPRPATFMLAWDARNIYMASRVYLRAGYKPRLGGGRVPDGADCYDDGLELLFKPMGKNVSALNFATEFKLNISCLGNGGTYTRLVVGQIMSNWEPKMRTATHVTAPGIAPDGGTWWEMETAFSLKDFELTGNNQAGDNWLMMLGINHLPMTSWMQARIPCMGGYFTPQGKCRVVLTENVPNVQMTMDSLSNIASDGTASLEIKSYNPTDKNMTVKINVNAAGVIIKEETMELSARQEMIYALNERLPEKIKDGKFSVSAVCDNQTLLSYNAFFKIGAFNERLLPVAAPNPDKFSFSVKFNPVRGLLQLQGDSYTLPEPDAVKSMVYEVKNIDTGKIIAAGENNKSHAWRYTEIISLPAIAIGNYEATGYFLLKNGNKYGPRNGRFEKKDEAKEFAHWWGKDTGNSERVLPPFTPIKRKGNTLSCWGREYKLTGLGLPASVKSQGRDVLAAPSRIIVVINGRETVVPAGKLRITEVKDWRVRFTGKTEGAGMVFITSGWMEQDGLVSVNLTYQSKSKTNMTIDSLRIEYPVADKVAESLVSVGPGANFAAMTATILPTEKQGRLWSVFDTGRKGSNMQMGSFYPHVWLGSEQRGFQWWADNDKGWFPDNEVPAHEVIRKDDAVILRNNIIGKPVLLTGSSVISFTWNASPFKALPKGWRMISATDDGTFTIPFRGVRTNPKTGQKYLNTIIANWIHPESQNPEDWAAMWAEQKTKGFGGFRAADTVVRERRPFDLYGSRSGISFQHMSFQLMGWGHKSMEDGVYNYFGDEWYPDDLDTWNPSYTDYGIYLLDRAFKEGGVVSTYWDLSFPILFSSPLSGLSYQLPDGRWQPGYNSLNCRRFFQRLWAVQDANGLNPGCTGSHSTQSYIFPTLPWIDAVLDGERDWNLDVSDMDWIDYYPKERMRAMSCPHNWGVGICWMSNYTSADRRKVIAGKTSQAEYLFIHDSWINPYMDPGAHVTRMPAPILDWGLNGSDVTYHPYWRNPYVISADKDLLVSLWRIPGEDAGRVLIGIFNYDRKNKKDVEIKIDFSALGLAKSKVVMRDLYRNYSISQAAVANKEMKEAFAIMNLGLGDAAEFDANTGILRVKALAAHRGRFIGIGSSDDTEFKIIKDNLPAGMENISSGIADLGFTAKGVKYLPAGSVTGAVNQNAVIKVAAWQMPDRVLLVISNTDAKLAKSVAITLDYDLLGLVSKRVWQDFIGIRDVYKVDSGGPATLDFYNKKLIINSLPAGSVRMVSIRRY